MKRRGFTLIELMVVIAIIIILAAIAIPNYLSMTARAKKSRVASDFAAIATALETYKTDWNMYPVQTDGEITVSGEAYQQLTGNGTTYNMSSGGTATAAGDMPPIEYMTATVLGSMANPYNNAATSVYKYSGSADHWLLYAGEATGDTQGKPWLSRRDTTTTLSEDLTTADAPAL